MSTQIPPYTSDVHTPISTDVVKVLLPLPLGNLWGGSGGGAGGGTYDYARGDTLVYRGSVVQVPLGNRIIEGVVVAPASNAQLDSPKNKTFTIKSIAHVLPCPLLPESLLDLVAFMADYYMVPAGAVLKMALSVPDALTPEPPEKGYILSPNSPTEKIRMTDARKAILNAVDTTPKSAKTLIEQSGAGTSVLKGLVSAGLITEIPMPAPSPFAMPDIQHYGEKRASLTHSQQHAGTQLADRVARSEFCSTVLDGVTGSGKTEVYFEAIAKALEMGKQALILLPEIALSAQWLQRFENRFGVAPAQWHSDLTPATRRKTWRGIIEGHIPIVVGARSALFLPLPNLGVIIVDEEHDMGFKQEEGVHYHARDMAVMRANLENIPCILASATPSIESFSNVGNNRYDCVQLPARFGGQDLPPIHWVDLRANKLPTGQWLSEPLCQAIGETLDKGQQVLLFLNRRGYAPLTLCRSCGHRLDCKQCDSYLVEHRYRNGGGHLECHHCGNRTPLTHTCPECGDGDSMVACGPGVERVLEEIMVKFPHARPEIATSETLSSNVSARDFVNRVETGAINVIIGTQIVAKGHHFPNLTLVGIVDGDMGLTGGDLRAGERTYQLLQQVSGRAGRGHDAGQVYMQTHNPDTPLMQALITGNRDNFLALELQARREGHYPPYGRLAGIIITGTDENRVQTVVADLRKTAPNLDKIRILGPVVPPLAMLRGKHRRRFLVHAMAGVKIQPVIREWIKGVKCPSNVRIQVDIDPYSFF